MSPRVHHLPCSVRLTGVAVLVVLAGWLLGAPPAWAVVPPPTPQPLSPEMRAIDVEDMRGQPIGKGLSFVDHTGARVELGDYFDGQHPVLISLNYFRCRVVCSVQLNGIADALHQVDWMPGQDYRVVTVSIDPRETPEDAAKKRATILSALGKGEDASWAFLTGDELEIRALAAQLGISYAYDAEQDQYAHPAVVNFITPDGRISRYVAGLAPAANDMRLGLIEAGEGKLGGTFEKIFASCFTYDHDIGRYGPWAFGIMRIGGVLIMIAVGGFLFFFFRRERRSRRDDITPGKGSGVPSNAEAI